VFECAARAAGEGAKDVLSARSWLDRAARVAGYAAPVLEREGMSEREDTDHADGHSALDARRSSKQGNGEWQTVI
jgi:hypothetical protein